jgi:hypothetical protein
MIDAALTDEEVEALSFSLMVDLTTLFKSLRADVIDAIRSDDPLAALDAVFDVIPLDADDEADADDQEAAAVYVDDVLEVLKGIERELRPMVAKARGDGPDEGDTKPGAEGALTFRDHRWRKKEGAGKDGREAEDGDEKDSAPKSVDRTGTDYSGVSYEIAVSKELQYLKERTEKTGHEFMSIMAKDRKICGTWEGTSSGVKLDENMLALLNDETYTDSISVMHTHTNGTGFSGKDLRTMCKYKTIHEMRIVCADDGTKYFMAIGKGKRVGSAELARKIAELSVQIGSRYNYVVEGKLVKSAFIRFMREINKSLQKEYNWDYDDGGQK